MENWIRIIQESFSISDSCLKLFGYANGKSMSKVKKFIENNSLDVSHFGIGKKNIKYNRIVKICPVCEIEFKTICDLKEKTTCSQRCSIKYFQHGSNNPNFGKESYKERYRKVSQTIIQLNQLKPKSIKLPKNERDGKKKSRSKIPMPTCGICHNSVVKRDHKFCSDGCRKIHFNSEEYRVKMSEVHKQLYKSGKTKGWATRNIESFPEKFFKRVLENNNIKYEFNKSISKKDLGVDEVGNYFLDFYIQGVNTDLEIDGGQHKFRSDHDQLRDSRISKLYKVYRIKWKSINSENGKKYIKEEIDKFLEFYKSEIKIPHETHETH